MAIVADLRCTHRNCRTEGVYRMIGACNNCGVKDVLMLFTAEHDAHGPHRCPVCRCSLLSAQRLATDDEIPDLEVKQEGPAL